MSRPITLALIGRGHWGKAYVRTIAGLAQSKAMPYSISLPTEHIFGKDYQEKFEKINPPDVGGIIIAATTAAHFEIATHLLEQGFRSILIEKPLTRTYAEAKKLENLMQTYPDAIVMVDHTLLYDPAYRVMKDTAPSKIGTLQQVRYTSLKTPPIEGETIIPDAGSPPVYLFLDIAQSRPTNVYAKPKINDNVELTLEFENGVQAVANIGSIYPERKREIVLEGENGNLTLTEFMNPRDLIFTDRNGAAEVVPFPTDRTALEGAILEFAERITHKRPPAIPLDAGAEVVRVIELAIQSFKQGGKSIPL